MIFRERAAKQIGPNFSNSLMIQRLEKLRNIKRYDVAIFEIRDRIKYIFREINITLAASVRICNFSIGDGDMRNPHLFYLFLIKRR